MIERDTIDQFKKRISSADGISDLLQALDDLLKFESQPDWGEELDRLRLEAFSSLARLTQDDPDEARPIIIRLLLPLCLRSEGEWRVPHIAHLYLAALSGWLDRYPAALRYSLRNSVLVALAEALGGLVTVKSCALIAKLGYRDEPLYERLLQLARSGLYEVCDVALHALTFLGISPLWRSALVELWLDRASTVPWNYELIGAARRLASEQLLDVVYNRWLTPKNLQESEISAVGHPGLAMAVPALVAERSPGDAELQDRVWERLRGLEPLAPELFFSRVIGSTEVAPRCDSPEVVRYYLSKLDGAGNSAHLSFYRLEVCIRPRQLLGWESVPEPKVLQTLLNTAKAGSDMAGDYVSRGMRLKLHAWETLLALSREEVLDGLETSLYRERNGYALAEVLSILACFQFDPLPERVIDLIAGKFEGVDDDGSQRLSSHIGAIAVAHASDSPAAFAALLSFNLIHEGGVLIRLLNALSDSAAAQIRRGDTSAVARLWRAAAPGEPQHRRTAAVAVLVLQR